MAKDIEKLRLTAKENPRSFEARMELGSGYMGINRYQDAWKEFQEAVTLAPGEAKGYTNLGMALVKLRRPEEALHALLKARALKPESAGVHFQLGALYESQGKRDEAAREYGEYLRIRPQATDRDIVEGRIKRLRVPLTSGTTGPSYGRRLRG